MPRVRVIIVTGLPGSGKTTLARELAARYQLPLIAKDLIKEPLLDVLGAADAAQSRRLSDASFAVLFSVARELKQAGAGALLLEGNFRPGEHEAPLREALGLAGPTAREPDTSRPHGASAATDIVQVLCRVPETERVARLRARENDPARHRGHRLGERTGAPASTARPLVPSGEFLELAGARVVHDGAGVHTVLAALDDWMNLRAPSL